ncbi:Glycoside hydrolase, catalytic domain and Glycoside hydrolase family 20, catalytic core domain and Glycoside hydrolase, superfamily domain and Beta-hexosaminidase family-containing protein [Strongyloides ratti]|uniref:Beta-hexosaminidase A n=1 Tax=Strongyloides ratti TaxID=34506 RepID=A0A090MP79_STRRB|nr:Glycoside hydrolase, catalytic domain and Glycoside hydrolase family 20, catalytic core domain and Glycoside hydrolase, superfamily domain and Beta-hexosaminidase family-containing protein [Strongyloides ratti]CEF59901.1 Glycoside hydrolase, catalytic domain and Glycoside hydrolase family 20, catalytic core domain and Glycoside hydrolase, superfamily domain and Beta-hexosaminidase family-containing protein [Strongyloides ratti]
MKKYFFPFKNKGNETKIILLEVSIKNCPNYREYPQIGMNENYELVINSNRTAKIIAKEVWGAIRGLESLSQVITYDYNNNIYEMRTLHVIDKPRFKVRGFLIDTSRHFLPIFVIKRHLDLMNMNKLNLLHWHIVDTQSFPYVSKRFPQLSKKGAYTPKHTYTFKDIQIIIDYAKIYGIIVMPEFDTPGHMGSWYGIDGLLTKCYNKDGNESMSIQPNLIDPSKESNFKFLKDFFTEIKSLFVSNWIHLGGDEVQFWEDSCWLNNPKIKSFMKEKGFKNDTKLLESYYIQRLSDIIRNVNKNWIQIFWEEIFYYSTVPKNSIVHVWRATSKNDLYNSLNEITKKGYNVIVSGLWYLNYVRYGSDWRQNKSKDINSSPALYDVDIQGFNGTTAQKNKVFGGIAAMWGEYIDQTNIESTSWPRGSAVAEKLWSSQNESNNADNEIRRFREHRCRMLTRGYQVSPTDGPDFCTIH